MDEIIAERMRKKMMTKTMIRKKYVVSRSLYGRAKTTVILSLIQTEILRHKVFALSRGSADRNIVCHMRCGIKTKISFTRVSMSDGVLLQAGQRSIFPVTKKASLRCFDVLKFLRILN